MEQAAESAKPHARLARLLGFLEADPENPSLIGACAETAFAAGDLDHAEALLTRYGAGAPLTPELANLSGLIDLAKGRNGAAAATFSGLRTAYPDDPGLLHNLVTALAQEGELSKALRLVEDVPSLTAELAALKLELLHRDGRVEDALAFGKSILEDFASERRVLSAMSLIALDAEELDLARRCAEAAGNSHEALSTLGMLSMNDDRPEAAAPLFDRALAVYPESARALLGKGMLLMAEGDVAAAAPLMERAAARFHTHLGSWIAAGWAHVVAGDLAGARALFDRAMAIDDTFAEAHGALAVTDILEGRIAEAERRTETALRLDRSCFAAALAKSMLLSRAGRDDLAERVRRQAINTPIEPGGRTLAEAMAGLGGRVKRQ